MGAASAKRLAARIEPVSKDPASLRGIPQLGSCIRQIGPKTTPKLH
jgi:hypothetical protein